jgi:hypothetical protein
MALPPQEVVPRWALLDDAVAFRKLIREDVVPIRPDDRDWTWVLERRCPECGFDASSCDPASVPGLLRANGGAWVRVLAGPPGGLRHRPSPDRWAPLEYACHVRDVCTLYHHRLDLMLTEDDPLYPNWDQDATAVEDGYLDHDPVTVAGQLRAAAEGLAAAFEHVEGAQWDRPGRRSDGAVFTVASFARYLIHDPVHHLYDVTGERAAAPG